MAAGKGLFGTNIGLEGIRTASIQPTGTPGSTFVRPQQKEVGGNLRALADALGGLNGALQNLGAASGRDGKDPDSDENRAFADSIAGMSLTEAMEKYPDAKNRIQKDGVLSLVGSKAAYEFRQHITEQYNNGGFDQSQGDFNSWVEGERQKFAGGLNDQAMQAAFFRGTDNWVQQFGEADLKRKVETAMTERDTAVVDEFRMIVDDGLGRMDDPAKIADDIINQSSQNRAFRGLDGRSQNETLFKLAEEYALKGQPELVKAILNHKRGGVGPLIEVSGITDKGLELIKQADAIQHDRSMAQSFDLMTKLDQDAMYGRLTTQELTKLKAKPGNEWLTDQKAAQYLETSKRNKATLLEQQQREETRRRTQFASTGQRVQLVANAYAEMETLGGAHRIVDTEYMGPDGNMKTLPARDAVKEVTKRKLAEFQEYEEGLVKANVSPRQAREMALQKRIEWFDGNGIVDEDLQKKFNSLYVQSSISRSLEKGEVTEHLSGVAEEYRQLHDINPAYADKMVTDEKAATFLQNYADARNDLMGAPDALIFAAKQTNRTPTEVALSKPAPKVMDETVDDILGELDLDAEPNSDNRAWVQDELMKNTSRGMPIERAQERVVKKLQESSFEINGHLIIDEDGLPKDAPELFQLALRDAFEALGKKEGIPDVEDLYIDKFASGQWIIMSKTKGYAPLNMGSRITVSDLARHRVGQERRRKALLEETRQADVTKRKAARDSLWRDLEMERKDVEWWEKRANNGKKIPAYMARKVRERYERRLKEFKTPGKPKVTEVTPLGNPMGD